MPRKGSKKKTKLLVTQDVKPHTPSSTDFTLSLSVNGKDITKSGNTILDCLNQITPNWGKGIGYIWITYNNKTSKIPIRLTPVKLERLFGREVDRALFAKRLITLM